MLMFSTKSEVIQTNHTLEDNEAHIRKFRHLQNQAAAKADSLNCCFRCGCINSAKNYFVECSTLVKLQQKAVYADLHNHLSNFLQIIALLQCLG